MELKDQPQTETLGTIVWQDLQFTSESRVYGWKFYAQRNGSIVLDIWKETTITGEYELVSKSSVVVNETGENTYLMDEADWVNVETGYLIGYHYVTSDEYKDNNTALIGHVATTDSSYLSSSIYTDTSVFSTGLINYTLDDSGLSVGDVVSFSTELTEKAMPALQPLSIPGWKPPLIWR